jgi:hypothetical protein
MEHQQLGWLVLFLLAVGFSVLLVFLESFFRGRDRWD